MLIKKLKIISYITMIALMIPFFLIFSGDVIAESVSDVIENGIIEMKEKINIDKFGITSDELYMIMRNIVYSNPAFFYLDLTYKYSCGEKNGKIISVSPSYNMTKTEVYDATLEYKSYVTEIADGAVGLSDAEKITYVHDKLAEMYMYDIECDVHDAYNFFKCGYGVCQAYTQAFSAVLSFLKIETSWAYSEKMDHIWNLVKLDGEWYHVDLTWDDSENGMYVYHDYFLLSDNEIKKRDHYDWCASYECNSVKYDNSCFREIKKPFAFAGKVYSVNSSGYVMTVSDDMSDFKEIIKLDDKWKVWDSDTEFYKGKYTSVAGIGETLYISGPDNVYRLSKNCGLESIYEYTGNEGFIYGIFENGGKLNLILSVSPKEEKVLYLEILSGDADGNGTLDKSDILSMMKYSAGWNVRVNTEFSDVNGDMKIDLKDSVIILKKISGIDVEMKYPY